MAAIIRRGKTWYTHWMGRKVNGKRKKHWATLKTTDRSTAMQKALDMENARRCEKTGDVPRRTALDSIIDRYMQYRTLDRRAGTVEYDAYLIGLFTAFRPIRYVDQINQGVIDDFRVYLKAKGPGAGVRNKAQYAIHRVIEYGADRNLCPRPQWRPIVERVDKTEKDYFTMPEIAAILSWAKGGMDTVIMLGAFGGLRPEEIRALRAVDVDFEAGVIKIRHYEGYRPKCGKQRNIPIHPDLRAHLKKVMKDGREWVAIIECDRGNVAKGAPGRHYKDRPRDARQLCKLFKPILKRLDLTGSPYKLRHTYGTMMAASGVPLSTLKDWMGQGSITMTDVYAHAAREQDQLFLARAPRLGGKHATQLLLTPRNKGPRRLANDSKGHGLA